MVVFLSRSGCFRGCPLPKGIISCSICKKVALGAAGARTCRAFPWTWVLEIRRKQAALHKLCPSSAGLMTMRSLQHQLFHQLPNAEFRKGCGWGAWAALHWHQHSCLCVWLCWLGMGMHKIPQRHGKKHIYFLETYTNWNHLPARSTEFSFPMLGGSSIKKKRQKKARTTHCLGRGCPSPRGVWRGNWLGPGVSAGGTLAACKCGEAFLQPSPNPREPP